MKKISAERVKLALTLFLSYFKIGLFTFGGGYAMIALIEREFVVRKKWINEVELYEIIAIAESTPGPIAINCATFVGYKIMGFIGSFLATLAVCIPSFAIIYLISVFYDAFMALTAVAYAFEGIKAGIAVMITTAGINMIRKAKKNGFAIGVFLLSFAAAACIDIFNLNFSTIYLILIGAALGIILQIARDIIAKKKGINTQSASDTCAERSDSATGEKDEKKVADGLTADSVKTGMASEIICRDGDYSFGMGKEIESALKEKEKSLVGNTSKAEERKESVVDESSKYDITNTDAENQISEEREGDTPSESAGNNGREGKA